MAAPAAVACVPRAPSGGRVAFLTTMPCVHHAWASPTWPGVVQSCTLVCSEDIHLARASPWAVSVACTRPMGCGGGIPAKSRRYDQPNGQRKGLQKHQVVQMRVAYQYVRAMGFPTFLLGAIEARRCKGRAGPELIRTPLLFLPLFLLLIVCS